MNSLLPNYTEKANFWRIYPAFKAPTIYKEFYNADKSKNKKNSSDIMWALTFLFDKTIDNPYKTLQSDERLEVINEDILNKYDFNWKPYKKLKLYTQNIFMNELERTYYDLIVKMEERRKLVNDTKYTLDNAKQIDDIIKSNKAIRDEMDNLKRIVEQKESDGVTKGNIIESATEKGLL